MTDTTHGKEQAMTTTTAASAAEFATYARNLGFTVTVRNTQEQFGKAEAQSWIVELERTFEPGDAGAYITAETDAFHALRPVPRPYPGPTWGSTSDSVGGHAALTSGRFHLCVSGVAASFAKALRKATR